LTRSSTEEPLDAAALIVKSRRSDSAADSATPGDTVFILGTIYRGGTLPIGIANNDPYASGGIGKIRCRALVLAPVTDLKKKD
jgi:hypothetical protein